MIRTLLLFIFFTLPLTAEPMLIIIRHGTADHNIQNRYNSNPNHLGYFPSHLTKKGKEEARATAQKLLCLGYNKNNIAALYVSPLPRTRETAAILVEMGVASPNVVKIDQEITELQMGDLEGQKQIVKWDPSFTEKYHLETYEHANERLKNFYNKIEETNGHVIVVTHGHIAKTLIEIITGQTHKFKHADFVIIPLKQPCKVQ